jgi:hypothetical protein
VAIGNWTRAQRRSIRNRNVVVWEKQVSRFRAALTAIVMFLGVTGTMGPLGALAFEETAPLAVYGGGVLAGAGWLSVGTYRASRTDEAARSR